MRAFVILITIALLVIVLVIATRHSQQSGLIVLQNGMRIELLGTGVGSATFSNEKRWHKLVRKVLPTRWQQWLPPASSGSCSGGANGITVYLLVTDPSGARVAQTPWQEYM